ncbi:MAG: hypothetical protein ABIX28_16010 [Vicinamibacterales bacterium]
MMRRVCEAIVKPHEGQRLVQLALEIEATRELHGITSPQAVAKQEGSGVGGNLWGELDNDQRGQIVRE